MRFPPAPAPPLGVAFALAFAGLLLAGCLQGPAPDSDSELVTYTGRACSEVGMAVRGDAEAAQAHLPPGFALRDASAALGPGAAGAALVVVAVNRCVFQVGEVRATEPELLVWLEVEPPPALRLDGAASQVVEVVDWHPDGALLDAVRPARPAAAPARFAGVPAEGFGAEADLAVVVRPSTGGEVRLEGQAGPQSEAMRHGDAPCCRMFSPAEQGLLVTDLVSTDQPQAEATCTVEATASPLVELLGLGPATGRCVVNLRYDFTALVTTAEAVAGRS